MSELFLGGQLSEIGSGKAVEIPGVYQHTGTAMVFTNAAAVAASASVNVKGAWVELTPAASNDFDKYGFNLSYFNNTFAKQSLFDVGLGASGSEVVVMSNLFNDTPKSAGRWMTNQIVPLFIPRLTRVAVRVQSNSASNGHEIWFNWFQKNQFPRIYRTCETFGADTSDSGGQSLDPGATINTYGAWTQLTAATTRRIRMMTMVTGNQANGARTDATWLYSIGVGGAGSEVSVISDMVQVVSSSADWPNPTVFGPFPVDIPAGSRVSARSYCTINDATDRLTDVVVYGYAP